MITTSGFGLRMANNSEKDNNNGHTNDGISSKAMVMMGYELEMMIVYEKWEAGQDISGHGGGRDVVAASQRMTRRAGDHEENRDNVDESSFTALQSNVNCEYPL